MASRRGWLIFLLLLVVLGAAVMSAVLLLSRPGPKALAPTVLVYRVPAGLDESQAPNSGFSLEAFRPERPTVWDVVHSIDQAADDDHIEALVLHIDGIDWGWAKVAEVRDALLRFRASGKRVTVAFAGGEEREYLLASAANRIAIAPLAILQLDGLTASAVYLKGTFEKLDIHPNFAHVGQFKSAVEGYTRADMSEPAREAMQSLLDDQFRLLVDSLAAARHMPADSIAHLLDLGPFASRAAVAAGLADTVLYEEQVDSMVVRAGRRRREAMPFTRYMDRYQTPGPGPRIALIIAAGAIASGRSRQSPMDGEVLGSETIIKALRDAAGHGSVKAIVLRIDSPGGSAQASDEIWHEIEHCRLRKPVIVSMSDLAASGGYYMAVAADSIVAQPGTITGSIGVFGGKLNLLGLYRKLGLNVVTLQRGAHAQMLSPFTDFTPEEAARVQTQMDGIYRGFVERVATGRRLDPATVDSIGQGRVWSGGQGRGNGLVDALGGMDRAFEMARARAGISPDEPLRVAVYPRAERTFLQWMLSGFYRDDDDETRLALAWTPVMQAWLVAARFPAGQALALMPYSIDIR